MTLPTLTIGGLRLSTPLLLAPVAGYTDLAFRLTVRDFGGVGMVYTDLLCPEGILRQTKRTVELSATCPEDWPLGVQLYGSDHGLMCEASRWAIDQGAAIVDINMGCPVDKITKRHAGSKLLCDPDGATRLVEALRRVVSIPLTVKMRLGWDAGHIVAPALARRLEEAGADAITIHGRTADMHFRGTASLDGIAAVVAAVRSIPVIGNGDVRSSADARRMLDYTRCTGVMVARAALSAPWLFQRIAAELSGLPWHEPSPQAKCATMLRHFDRAADLRGEARACTEFRKKVSWYAKQLNPCPTLREDLRLVSSRAEMLRSIERFLSWRHERELRRPAAPPAALAVGV